MNLWIFVWPHSEQWFQNCLLSCRRENHSVAPVILLCRVAVTNDASNSLINSNYKAVVLLFTFTRVLKIYIFWLSSCSHSVSISEKMLTYFIHSEVGPRFAKFFHPFSRWKATVWKLQSVYSDNLCCRKFDSSAAFLFWFYSGCAAHLQSAPSPSLLLCVWPPVVSAQESRVYFQPHLSSRARLYKTPKHTSLKLTTTGRKDECEWMNKCPLCKTTRSHRQLRCTGDTKQLFTKLFMFIKVWV